MCRNIFLFLLIQIPVLLCSQNFWTKTDPIDVARKDQGLRTLIPDKYEVFSLDKERLKEYLKQAPLETVVKEKSKELIIKIPMPFGDFESFILYESPNMESEISARFPEIKSYKAYHQTDKSKHMRFSLSPFGFHAAIYTAKGEIYIDPYSENNSHDYIIYYTKDHHSDMYKGVDLCGVDDSNFRPPQHFNPGFRSSGAVELRKYRMAMACTGEWGIRRGTVAKCLADMNTMINRLNMIYERDLAVRFMLINDNDKLIFLDPNTDPYINADKGRELVGVNTMIINSIIPSNSYDLGHVLAVCNDVGGVAALGSACQSSKGNAVTCHNNNELNSIVTRILAHEVGHQFNATHTFNICTSSPAARSAQTAYEPGSGTTIMSYVGTCGVDNVANSVDDYFHVASLEQMLNKTMPGGNAYACANTTFTGNQMPEIIMPIGGFFIPVLTPFELNASAYDPDGDNMTYNWEQFDLGVQIALGEPSNSSPLFRSVYPGTSTTRFFPIANNIFSNRLNEKNEVLPNTTRKFTFRFVVRDNNPAGGGTTWDEISFNSTANAGPFKLTSFLTHNVLTVGQAINITWDVANTDKSPVNCANVNIYVSVDGALRNGDTKLIPVAVNVPNTGSAEIIIPNAPTIRARFVIKAADNIFLTTSIQNSTIVTPLSPSIYMAVENEKATVCLPENASYVFSTEGIAGLTDSIQFEILEGLPEDILYSFSKNKVAPGENTTLNLDLSRQEGTKNFRFKIRAYVPGVDTLERSLRLDFTGTDLDFVQLLTPAEGASGVNLLPGYSWNLKTDATAYEIEVATNPSFSSASLVTQTTRTDSFLLSGTTLEKSRIYYWRVRSSNHCRQGEWSLIQAFSTETSSCKTYGSGPQSIILSASGTPTAEISINIPDDGIISDVNVPLVKGEHNRVGDLVAFLVSPSDKEVLLWSRKCGTNKNFDVGLDDESPAFFQCPINTKNIYRPESPLSALNGDAIKGIWKVRVEDRQPGEGGRFQEVELELCSNTVLNQPFFIRKEILQVAPGDRKLLNDLVLLVEDQNNTAEQLVFTLVTIPRNGNLQLDNLALAVGDQFTQADLNGGRIKYKHSGSTTDMDAFSFTVIDGEGGWIPITNFEIEIDPSFPSSTDNELIINHIHITPNPARDHIMIRLEGEALTIKYYTLTDVKGHPILSGEIINGEESLDISNLVSGFYLLRLENGKKIFSKKLIKI